MKKKKFNKLSFSKSIISNLEANTTLGGNNLELAKPRPVTRTCPLTEDCYTTSVPCPTISDNY